MITVRKAIHGHSNQSSSLCLYSHNTYAPTPHNLLGRRARLTGNLSFFTHRQVLGRIGLGLILLG